MKSHLLVLSVLVTLVSVATVGCGKSQKNKSTALPPAPPPIEEVTPAPEVQVETAATPVPSPTPAEIIDVSTLGAENVDADLKDYDVENHRYAEIFTMGRDLTGLKNEKGLVYTGSSVDNLLSDLLKKMSKLPSAQIRERHLKAAQSIRKVDLSIDAQSKDLVIAIDLEKNKRIETVILQGSLNLKNSYGQSISLLESKNPKSPIKAILTCLDIDRQCETSRLQIRMGASEKAAVVEVVLRQNYSDLHVDFPKQPEASPEYLAIENFFYNSTKYVSEERVKEIKMSTYEVVNGVSGFHIGILGYNKQYLSFRGELLAPSHGTAVSLNLDRSTNLYPAYGSDLANKISEARLVNNNGLGQLRIEIQSPAKRNYASNQTYMTFKRILKPISYKL